MELPLCRVRQILELIVQDRREEFKFNAQLIEWQTKNIASMFTVAARDSKQVRSIQKAIKQMNLPLTDEEADITSRELNVVDDELQASTPEDLENVEDFIDLDSQPAFEDLIGAFSDMDVEEDITQ